jgi:formyltetrahydrofolate deformylase
MRLAIDPAGFNLTEQSFPRAWQPLVDRFQMHWRIHWGAAPKRMVILVSRQTHCLADLLWRWKFGELDVDVPLVISNHDVGAPIARESGVPFVHLPVTPETRRQQEAQILHHLAESRADFVVLARYMQILSPALVARFPDRIINIHHSFLPAFAGGAPYKQAYERGVKMIGATSHYVTPELDAGPIIAQDTAATSHRDTVADLERKGRDLERVVLARAVRRHVDDKILVSQNKTVVFD